MQWLHPFCDSVPDTTAAPFLVSFSKLLAIKKRHQNGAAMTSYRPSYVVVHLAVFLFPLLYQLHTIHIIHSRDITAWATLNPIQPEGTYSVTTLQVEPKISPWLHLCIQWKRTKKSNKISNADVEPMQWLRPFYDSAADYHDPQNLGHSKCLSKNIEKRLRRFQILTLSECSDRAPFAIQRQTPVPGWLGSK